MALDLRQDEAPALQWEGSCGWPGSDWWVFSAWFWFVTFEATGDGICKSPLIIQPLSSCRLKITLLWIRSYFVEKWLVQDHTSEAATKMQVSSHSLACSQQLHFMELPHQILITGLGRLSHHVPFGACGFFYFRWIYGILQPRPFLKNKHPDRLRRGWPYWVCQVWLQHVIQREAL